MERLLFERRPGRSPLCLYGETPEITSLRPPERLGWARRRSLTAQETDYHLVLGRTLFPSWLGAHQLLGLSIRVGTFTATLYYFAHSLRITKLRDYPHLLLMDPAWLGVGVHCVPPA